MDVARGLSSLTTVSVASSAVRSPPFTVPETVTSGFGPSSSLSTAVIVTSPVLSVAFSAKLSVVFELSSTPSAGETDTSTVNAVAWACGIVAVTVLVPPFSSIEAGVNTSLTRGLVTLSKTIMFIG